MRANCVVSLAGILLQLLLVLLGTSGTTNAGYPFFFGGGDPLLTLDSFSYGSPLGYPGGLNKFSFAPKGFKGLGSDVVTFLPTDGIKDDGSIAKFIKHYDTSKELSFNGKGFKVIPKPNRGLPVIRLKGPEVEDILRGIEVSKGLRLDGPLIKEFQAEKASAELGALLGDHRLPLKVPIVRGVDVGILKPVGHVPHGFPIKEAPNYGNLHGSFEGIEGLRFHHGFHHGGHAPIAIHREVIPVHKSVQFSAEIPDLKSSPIIRNAGLVEIPAPQLQHSSHKFAPLVKRPDLFHQKHFLPQPVKVIEPAPLLLQKEVIPVQHHQHPEHIERPVFIPHQQNLLHEAFQKVPVHHHGGIHQVQHAIPVAHHVLPVRHEHQHAPVHHIQQQQVHVQHHAIPVQHEHAHHHHAEHHQVHHAVPVHHHHHAARLQHAHVQHVPVQHVPVQHVPVQHVPVQHVQEHAQVHHAPIPVHQHVQVHHAPVHHHQQHHQHVQVHHAAVEKQILHPVQQQHHHHVQHVEKQIVHHAPVHAGHVEKHVQVHHEPVHAGPVVPVVQQVVPVQHQQQVVHAPSAPGHGTVHQQYFTIHHTQPEKKIVHAPEVVQAAAPPIVAHVHAQHVPEPLDDKETPAAAESVEPEEAAYGKKRRFLRKKKKASSASASAASEPEPTVVDAANEKKEN